MPDLGYRKRAATATFSTCSKTFKTCGFGSTFEHFDPKRLNNIGNPCIFESSKSHVKRFLLFLVDVCPHRAHDPGCPLLSLQRPHGRPQTVPAPMRATLKHLSTVRFFTFYLMVALHYTLFWCTSFYVTIFHISLLYWSGPVCGMWCFCFELRGCGKSMVLLSLIRFSFKYLFTRAVNFVDAENN